MLQIKKVLNSSVVLAVKQEKELILLGKGIGYGKKIGSTIEEADVDQIFMPVESTQAQHVLELLTSIPPDFLELTRDIVHYAETKLDTQLNSSIYFTLTDHLNFAVERFKKEINIVNRVYWEIKNYYPREFAIGEYSLLLIKQKMKINLPKEEAANIAFHLINAQGKNDTVADGMKSAKMIGGIVNLVRYSLNENIDTESIHYSRFITHVKFFVERFFNDELLIKSDNTLFEQIAILYPKAMNGAFKVREYIEQIYDVTISNEELSYLAVHINRLISYNEIN